MGAVALAVPLSLGLAHVANAAAPAPAIKLAQNSSDDITPLEGIACNGGTVLATDYYRRFDLSGYGAANGLTVSSISFGVEQADSTDGTIPGSVAVYAIDHAATLTVANLGTALTTVPVNIDTVANGAILTAPITGTVPAGKDLVIKASVESAATDEVFFMGANTASETKDAYLAAPDCGASAPTSLGDLGLPAPRSSSSPTARPPTASPPRAP